MTVIKIADLNPDWIELQSSEAEAICGGRGHRYLARIASLVSDFQFSFSSIENSTPTSGSFPLKITDASGRDRVTATINGTQIETSGNLFYTDSGIAPIGGVPIPGQPGAYTF
jgi:hypothetical protein